MSSRIRCIEANCKVSAKNPARFILLSLLAVFVSVANASQEWTPAKEGERIQVYTRSEGESPFLAVKAMMTVAATRDKVGEVFGDGERCSEWRKMCKSSEVLAVLSAQERIVYLVLDLPWPISDRDMVMRSVSVTDREKQTLTVHLQTDSSQYPPGKYVRAESTGSYVIRIVDDEHVEITYIMHVDLGGDLSPKIINSQLVSSTFADMERLLILAEG